MQTCFEKAPTGCESNSIHQTKQPSLHLKKNMILINEKKAPMTDAPSQEWTARMRAVIPWGSSTCSKAPLYAPDEPEVIVRGRGCRVWDAVDREFIDYRNGLGPVTLGYCFEAVDDAIRQQLASGIIFGHPHPLECLVAEQLAKSIPCADRVRFLKTGGEAVAACIRLARSHTAREHVVQIGYNGWLNSLAGGARFLPNQTAVSVPPGVPKALSELHHACAWNDTETLEKLFSGMGDRIAALVVAADYSRIEEGETFYPYLRRLADRHGTVLIFDEIVTGFRVALAGVQEFFGVKPDLAIFAKGVANGMPLAVYCGRGEIMDRLDRTVVSSTYGGEVLSLAAAQATIETYLKKDVVSHLWKIGGHLKSGLGELFGKYGLPFSVRGFPPCFMIVPEKDAPPNLSEKLFRAAYRNGVSLYSVVYANFSHQESDVDETMERLGKALKSL